MTADVLFYDPHASRWYALKGRPESDVIANVSELVVNVLQSHISLVSSMGVGSCIIRTVWESGRSSFTNDFVPDTRCRLKYAVRK